MGISSLKYVCISECTLTYRCTRLPSCLSTLLMWTLDEEIKLETPITKKRRCPSFLSVAVLKHPGQKQLGKERVYLV